MNNTYCVIEFYELSGLGLPKEAEIAFRGTMAECVQFIADRTKLNRVLGDSDYRYEIEPEGHAQVVVDSTNAYKLRAVKEFRHRVYGEPLMA